jgi:hypothetical protein
MPVEEHIQYVPEPSDVNTFGVLWSAAGALVLLAGAIGVLFIVYQKAVPDKTIPIPQKFNQPRVETNQQEVLERQRITAAQEKQLKTWRWANDQHTRIQIPIERAMQLLMREGGNAYAPLLPPQPALSSPTSGAERVTTPQMQQGPSSQEQRP